MKISIHNSVQRVWLIFPIILATIILIVGCATPKPAPNPLEGWHFCVSQDPDKLNKAIIDDYRDYIEKLPTEEKKYAGPIHTFEDGTGRHAVMIIIGLNGTVWRHVLIYDKDNQRIETIKYASGDYHS